MGDQSGFGALVEYCAAVDRHDAAAVGELFCEDGRAELMTGTANGRDEVIAVFASLFENPAPSLHAVGAPSPQPTPAGDDVAFTAPFLVWVESPDTSALVGRGRYVARVRAERGRWLIADLAVEMDGPLMPVAPAGTDHDNAGDHDDDPDNAVG